MKALLLTLFCANLFVTSGAQVNNLIGTWSIIDLTYVSDQGTQKVMEAEIKAGTAITDLYIMNDGKFKQTSNMSGTGTMDTYEGTWNTDENKLVFTLKIGEQVADIEYKYELKENILYLIRSNPQETMKITMNFKKK